MFIMFIIDGYHCLTPLFNHINIKEMSCHNIFPSCFFWLLLLVIFLEVDALAGHGWNDEWCCGLPVVHGGGPQILRLLGKSWHQHDFHHVFSIISHGVLACKPGSRSLYLAVSTFWSLLVEWYAWEMAYLKGCALDVHCLNCCRLVKDKEEYGLTLSPGFLAGQDTWGVGSERCHVGIVTLPGSNRNFLGSKVESLSWSAVWIPSPLRLQVGSCFILLVQSISLFVPCYPRNNPTALSSILLEAFLSRLCVLAWQQPWRLNIRVTESPLYNAKRSQQWTEVVLLWAMHVDDIVRRRFLPASTGQALSIGQLFQFVAWDHFGCCRWKAIVLTFLGDVAQQLGYREWNMATSQLTLRGATDRFISQHHGRHITPIIVLPSEVPLLITPTFWMVTLMVAESSIGIDGVATSRWGRRSTSNTKWTPPGMPARPRPGRSSKMWRSCGLFLSLRFLFKGAG